MEVNSNLFLVRLNMKTLREGDKHGLKMGQNRGDCIQADTLLFHGMLLRHAQSFRSARMKLA